MKRSLTLTLLLATMFTFVACGGSERGRSERVDPAEPQQTQAEPAAQSSPEESAREESAREESAREESARERVPADEEPAQSEQGPAQEGEGSSGLSVTTLEGEQVNLRGQGDVTALYFMAGW